MALRQFPTVEAGLKAGGRRHAGPGLTFLVDDPTPEPDPQLDLDAADDADDVED